MQQGELDDLPRGVERGGRQTGCLHWLTDRTRRCREGARSGRRQREEDEWQARVAGSGWGGQAARGGGKQAQTPPLGAATCVSSQIPVVEFRPVHIGYIQTAPA